MFPSCSQAYSERPDAFHAVYRLIGSSEHHEPPAETIEILTGPAEKRQGRDLFWWELKINKTKSISFRCQILSDQVPMFQSSRMPTIYAVYRLEEPGHSAVEYVDAESGFALLPRFQFTKNFIPNPASTCKIVKGFLNAGNILGHAITLQTVDTAGMWKPIEAKPLLMNRNLLIATSRTVRDDGKGRKGPGEEYKFVPLQDQDYRELIDAGFNLFMATDALMNKLYDQPVFFATRPVKALYPELFYRSSYQGPSMYIDEPAVRCGKTLWSAEVRQIDAVPGFLTTYVATLVNRAKARPRELLAQEDVALGTIDLTDYDIASWDTNMETAFYQFPTDVGGLVFENRDCLDAFNHSLSLYFGSKLSVTREEMLYLQNAIMRGAARNFNKHWGTSIYGQMEEETRIPCAIKAYAMGARYIWYWTSDGDHHVPFSDQLAITSAVTRHAKEHPRKPVAELLRKADTVITIPNGYDLEMSNYLCPQGALWAISYLSFVNPNVEGIPYKEILASAMWEGIQCLRRGEDFDFAIDNADFKPAGYRRVIRVLENGEVIQGSRMIRPSRISMLVKDATAAIIPSPSHTMSFSSVRPVIDGKLNDWKGANWVSLDQIAGATGAWPVSKADLSARFAFAADAERFYIAAKVQDDDAKPFQDYPHISGDMIEVVLDPYYNRGGRFRTDDLAIGLAMTPSGPSVWRAVSGFSGRPGTIPGATVQIRKTKNGSLLYEAALPLREIAPLDPLVRNRIGINFAAIDVDDGKPDRYVQWTTGLREGWRMPEKWGVIDWTPPADTSTLPLRSQFDIIKTAGTPGDEWKFDIITSAWQETEVTIRAELVTDGKRKIKAETAMQLAGRQHFHAIIPTMGIKPGRYSVILSIDSPGQSTESFSAPVYLFSEIAQQE